MKIRNRDYEDRKTLELQAKVRAANAANAYATELYPKLVEIFRPYVGQKIETVSGPLLAKIAKLVPEFPYSHALHVYRHTSNYSLAWTVKTCETSDTCTGGGQIAHYWETVVYIGDMSNGVLTKLCESYQDKPVWRSDYTVKEVIANQQAARTAKDAYDAARSNCYPFSES